MSSGKTHFSTGAPQHAPRRALSVLEGGKMTGEDRKTVRVGALSDLDDELRDDEALHVERHGRQRDARGPIERGKGLEAAEAEAGVPAVELAADAALGERAVGEAVGGLVPGDKAEGHPLALELGYPGGSAMTRPVAGSLAPEYVRRMMNGRICNGPPPCCRGPFHRHSPVMAFCPPP